MSRTDELAESEAERAAGWFDDQQQDLGYDLDDLFAEDDAALDFAAEPAPVEGLDAIDRRGATLRRAERRLADYDRLATDRRAELAARIEHGRRPLLEKVGYLRRSLELAHAAILADDPKRTRIDLPSVTLTSKAGGVEWVWPEPDTHAEGELLAWVRSSCPAAYVPPDNVPVPARVSKVPLKAALKDAATTKRHGMTVPANEEGEVIFAGEHVPGVWVRSKPRTFTPLTVGMDENEQGF